MGTARGASAGAGRGVGAPDAMALDPNGLGEEGVVAPQPVRPPPSSDSGLELPKPVAGAEILQILGGGGMPAPVVMPRPPAQPDVTTFATSLSPPSRSFTNPITRDRHFGNAPILDHIVATTGTGPSVPLAFSPPR